MPKDFLQLGIGHVAVDALRKNGIVEPTKIQQETIPLLLKGRDVVAQGQTGTGKTLAFVLPMLQRLDTQKSYIQGLIITPTRELAIQITAEINKYAELYGAKVLACYGGQDVDRQIQRLRTRHIVVGTPGRLLEHLGRGTIQLHNVNMVVLDEADQMLHLGFLPDVEEIIKKIGARRQMMLFSATIPKHIRILSKKYMKKPMDIRVQVSKKITLDEIQQIIINVEDSKKLKVLTNLIDAYRPYLAMIFCKSKDRAKELYDQLIELGCDCDVLHGELSQIKRQQVMRKFREAKLQILVATDIAARGIDVEAVTHIFNYDIPRNTESYIHRIGRTGRAGEEGMAVTFVTADEYMVLEKIEKGIAAKIERREQDGETVIKAGVKSRPLSGNKPIKPRRSETQKNSPRYANAKGTKNAKNLRQRSGKSRRKTRS